MHLARPQKLRNAQRLDRLSKRAVSPNGISNPADDGSKWTFSLGAVFFEAIRPAMDKIGRIFFAAACTAAVSAAAYYSILWLTKL
jgi:hypothetical protein